MVGKARAFLAALVQAGGNLTRAAEFAGIDRGSHYFWLKEPEYAEAFEIAAAQANDALEAEAKRRAFEGVRKPIVSMGKVVMVPKLDGDGKPVLDSSGEIVEEPLMEIVYSDGLMQFLLRGAKPDVYKERSTVEVSASSDLLDRLAAGRRRAAESMEPLLIEAGRCPHDADSAR